MQILQKVRLGETKSYGSLNATNTLSEWTRQLIPNREVKNGRAEGEWRVHILEFKKYGFNVCLLKY